MFLTRLDADLTTLHLPVMPPVPSVWAREMLSYAQHFIAHFERYCRAVSGAGDDTTAQQLLPRLVVLPIGILPVSIRQ